MASLQNNTSLPNTEKNPLTSPSRRTFLMEAILGISAASAVLQGCSTQNPKRVQPSEFFVAATQHFDAQREEIQYPYIATHQLDSVKEKCFYDILETTERLTALVRNSPDDHERIGLLKETICLHWAAKFSVKPEGATINEQYANLICSIMPRECAKYGLVMSPELVSENNSRHPVFTFTLFNYNRVTPHDFKRWNEEEKSQIIEVTTLYKPNGYEYRNAIIPTCSWSNNRNIFLIPQGIHGILKWNNVKVQTKGGLHAALDEAPSSEKEFTAFTILKMNAYIAMIKQGAERDDMKRSIIACEEAAIISQSDPSFTEALRPKMSITTSHDYNSYIEKVRYHKLVDSYLAQLTSDTPHETLHTMVSKILARNGSTIERTASYWVLNELAKLVLSENHQLKIDIRPNTETSQLLQAIAQLDKIILGDPKILNDMTYTLYQKHKKQYSDKIEAAPIFNYYNKNAPAQITT